MANRQQNDLPRVTAPLPSLSGGINTSVPDTDIADNEAVEILNFEFNDDNNLVTRSGVSKSVYPGLWDIGLWDVALWGVGSYESATRITSLYYFKADAGEVGILFTVGTKLYSMTTDGLTVTDLTGALVLPNNVFWQWVTFTGLAIGVNKATSGSNPVKVTGPAPGTAAALGGSPPRAKYITTWNNRLFVADASNFNRIQCSDLGNAESWNTDGGTNAAHGVQIDISPNDGDLIMGLIVFRERLFVFKRKAVYVISISDSSLPNTDPDNWRVDLFTSNIGCISPYSIQPVLDDVLFLSEYGVASLASAQIVGNFSSAIISHKVTDLAKVQLDNEEIPSMVAGELNQYWISIPAASSATQSDTAYIFDFKEIEKGVKRWIRFDGLPAATAYTSFIDGRKVYVMGCFDASANVYFPGFYYPRILSFSDGINAYTKRILSKNYSQQNSQIRKLYYFWSLTVRTLSEVFSLTLNYYFNSKQSVKGSYGFVMNTEVDGSFYDVDVYDTATYDGISDNVFDILRDFLRGLRKAKTVQFEYFNNQINHGAIIENMQLNYANLNEKHTSDI